MFARSMMRSGQNLSKAREISEILAHAQVRLQLMEYLYHKAWFVRLAKTMAGMSPKKEPLLVYCVVGLLLPWRNAANKPWQTEPMLPYLVLLILRQYGLLFISQYPALRFDAPIERTWRTNPRV